MKKIPLTDERVKVVAHFLERGSVLRGDKQGACEGFVIEMDLASEAPAETIAEALRLAHRMCFTEAALTSAVPVTARHRLNGKALEIEGEP